MRDKTRGGCLSRMLEADVRDRSVNVGRPVVSLMFDQIVNCR
jgi:hypothetical protein